MIDWTKFLPNARHVATLPRLKPRTAICRLNVVRMGFASFLVVETDGLCSAFIEAKLESQDPMDDLSV